MSDGVPETASRRFGYEIARLRTRKAMSRSKLVMRLWQVLAEDDKMADHLTEGWIRRLEAGQVVKIPRAMVEAQCVALGVSSRERARLLLLADRNVLYSADEEPDRLSE